MASAAVANRVAARPTTSAIFFMLTLPDRQAWPWVGRYGGQRKGAPGWTRPITDLLSDEVGSGFGTETVLLAGTAGDHVLGLFEGQFAVLVIGGLDHVLALRLTLGFVG